MKHDTGMHFSRNLCLTLSNDSLINESPRLLENFTRGSTHPFQDPVSQNNVSLEDK